MVYSYRNYLVFYLTIMHIVRKQRARRGKNTRFENNSKAKYTYILVVMDCQMKASTCLNCRYSVVLIKNIKIFVTKASVKM